jgi:hypothetical protein
MNREEWLAKGALAMKDWVTDCEEGRDYLDPHVSVGFPKGTRGKSTNNVIGQCWDKSVSEDKERAHIFIVPTMTNAVDVLAVLLHDKVALEVGLEGKMTATVPGDALRAKLEVLADELGPYPHVGLKVADRGSKGSRLLKVACPGCGCIIRMTQKWIDEQGCPTCGCGTSMEQAQ